MTRLFEGEPGHLIPSTDGALVDSDFFLIAGRMVGHGIIHGGPGLAGLSPAIIHFLRGGSPDTVTIVLEDCADHEYRKILKLVSNL